MTKLPRLCFYLTKDLTLAFTLACLASGAAAPSFGQDQNQDQNQAQNADQDQRQLRAEQMSAATVAHLQQRGPDAWGGIGDWHLSNGTLCATISAVGHESDLSAQGGSLIDLGFCGRADDQLVVMHDLLNGSTANPINTHAVEAVNSTKRAAIRTYSGHGGLTIETTFSLDLEQPTQLQIHKRIKRQNDDAPDFFAYVPVLFNFHSMETFVLHSTDPNIGSGFAHEGFFDKGASSFGAAAQAADTIVAIGSPDTGAPISYGWQLRSAQRHQGDVTSTLPAFALSDQGSTVFLITADDFLVGDNSGLGLLQLLQLTTLGLEPGEEIRTAETLYIGANSDVATITDQLHAQAPVLSGQVNSGEAVVHINNANGTPYSFATTDTQGRFALRVPPGNYQLRAVAPGNLSVSKSVEVNANSPAVTLNLPKPNRLQLPQGQPMRLVFQGLDGAPDPQLDDTLTGTTIYDDGVARSPAPMPAVFLAGVPSDPQYVDLPVGRYRVIATRGIEHELSETQVEIVAGTTQTLEIAVPKRAFASPGYIAADFHVHSAPSMDNGFSTQDRVRTFVAEQGEVMVAAEHETVFDYNPLLRQMGVTDRMIAIAGTETTGQVPTARMPHTAGHANFFPLPEQLPLFRRGVPANEGRRLREILYDIQQQDGEVVSQLNHARENDQFLQDMTGDVRERINNGAYFDHMGPAAHPYNPLQPLTSEPNHHLVDPDPITGIRDIDFDAMEILNGPHSYSPTRRRALLADWLSLLNQGIRISGTANSDSHNKSQQVALPRNMVALTADSIEGFDKAAFIRSIKQGNLYGTTGPLLTLELNDVNMGGTLNGNEGTLTGQVQTASWVSAQRYRVLVNGITKAEGKLSPQGGFSLPLSFAKDSHVVVEIEGEPGADYQTLYPGQLPYAFSNPIYVDADGDGQWQPPGLP